MENQVVVNPEFLNSWKEIANYMGRGVRTVQRWEELYGLPVRRVNGSGRGSVISTRSEIDAWFAARGAVAKASTGSSRAREVTEETSPESHLHSLDQHSLLPEHEGSKCGKGASCY